MNQAEFPGHVLRERREALGLSRLDVFEHVRVPVQYLEALEAADFRELPCAAYAVGFLASYCQFLGLEPDPFVDHYWSRVREAGATRQATASRFFPARSESGEGRPRWLTELIAWGAICGVLLLGWLTYAVVVRPLTESAETRVDAGAHEAPPVHFEEEF